MLSRIMHFFSTKDVKNKIDSGTLSEGQLFLYFYLILIYDALGFTQQWLSIAGKQPTTSDTIIIWSYLFITVIGLLILFVANGASKGKNFLAKYFAFSFTVGIKYAIVFVVLGFLPSIISIPNIGYYNIFINIFINLVMILNIAFWIYSTKEKKI